MTLSSSAGRSRAATLIASFGDNNSPLQLVALSHLLPYVVCNSNCWSNVCKHPHAVAVKGKVRSIRPVPEGKLIRWIRRWAADYFTSSGHQEVEAQKSTWINDEPLISHKKANNMYCCWFSQEVFSDSHSHKHTEESEQSPSQWGAWGSAENRAVCGWVACESHSVPRRTFTPDFTSPFCLAHLFTLRWPPGGQHVLISCQPPKTWVPFVRISGFLQCWCVSGFYVCTPLFAWTSLFIFSLCIFFLNP